MNNKCNNCRKLQKKPDNPEEPTMDTNKMCGPGAGIKKHKRNQTARQNNLNKIIQPLRKQKKNTYISSVEQEKQRRS